MRTYLSFENLVKASALSAVATAMAAPRLIEGRLSLAFFIPAAFLALVLVGGAATAWSTSAGMAGLFPERRRLLKGLGVALALALIFLPAALWLDPVLRSALEETGDMQRLALRYPATLRGCLALMLWAAGFETIFSLAAVISFLARLTGSAWAALAGAVLLRLWMTYLQCAGAGLESVMPLFMVSSAILMGVGGLLFVRAGLPAAALFTALLDARHLF